MCLEEHTRIYDLYDFDYLMERMLSRVPDTLDKREGSVIWDALAPAAKELELLYGELEVVMKNMFSDTADREWLIRLAADRDVHILPATHAVVKGEFDAPIELGSRFNYENLNYVAFEEIGVLGEFYYYQLRCETPGRVGNVDQGRIKPIGRMPNLSHAMIAGVLVPGEDDEDTEAFRKRYFDTIRRQPYGGNIDDYLMKTNEIEGVGGVKVYPVWNGGGTVKLVIQDSEYKAPSKELLERVQAVIDPVTNQGKGIGVAPVGHTVTVVGVKEVPVSITLHITYEANASWETTHVLVEKKIEAILQEVRQGWAESESSIVRLSQIEAALLQIKGIIDVEHTEINGKQENLRLADDEIPVLGVITHA